MVGSKKRILFLVVIILLLAIFSACAKNDSNSDTISQDQQTGTSVGEKKEDDADTTNISPIYNGGVFNTNNYN